MQDAALRWSQCISSRSSFSLLVGSGNRSAAGGGAAGRADALAAVTGPAALGSALAAAGGGALGSLLLAATAELTGPSATLALVALGVWAAIAATGRSGKPDDGGGAFAGAPPELPIAANAPAVPPRAIASQVATRAAISSALGARVGHRRSACGRGRLRTVPSDRGYFPAKAGGP